jgi:hypothetical protein
MEIFDLLDPNLTSDERWDKVAQISALYILKKMLNKGSG